MSSGWVEAGFSIAKRERIWSKWFCMTSRIMPNSSKYPPLPKVPKGSLKEINTEAILSLFQVGPNIRLPNLLSDNVIQIIHPGILAFLFWAKCVLPKCHQVLDHFLSQVVIDAIQLFFFKKRSQMARELSRGLAVLSKWFLNNHPCPAPNNDRLI